MGLTDDQKAMLRLLAQREEGYEDMAALMGISVEEVRERVKEALAEVDEPAAGVEQAPEVAAPLAPEPPQPQATEPPVPPAPAPASPEPAAESAPKARAARRPPKLPGLKLPKDRGALVGLGAGALVVVALVIVLILGGDGGGSDSAATTASEAQGDAAPTAAENQKLTQAVLSPVDGGEADGRALFGLFKKSILLQVDAQGLEPSPQGSSYAVWLSRGAKPTVPVGAGRVNESGRLVARFPLPEAVLVLVARGTLDAIDVTLADDTELATAVEKTRRTGRAPSYAGDPVLRGPITGPLVGAASNEAG